MMHTSLSRSLLRRCRDAARVPLLCGLLLAAGLAGAADGKLVMNMRDADIRALIQWVADVTGKNLIVHKDVQGKVTVLSSGPVTPEEAYQVFLATLDVHGFAAIDADGAVKIVPQSMANSSSPPLARAEGGETVVNVIRARNVPVSELVNNIRPLVPSSALLAAYPENNSLIIASSANNVRRVNELIARLDTGTSLEFESVRLEHANAEDVAKNLGELIPGLQGGEGFHFVKVSVDSRTNTIMLGGDPANRRQVRSIIKSLDTEVGGGNTDVINLQYVQADEMLAILKGIAEALQEGGGEKGGGGSKVSIEASKSANALVINAPPAILAKMRNIIKQVDKQRPQVLVEALVVEVTGDASEEFGVSWLSANHMNSGTDAINAGIDTVPDRLGNYYPVINPRAERISGAALGGGLTLGYFDDGDLRAVVRALGGTTKANILSTPTIVALDNEEAKLLVGQNVPFKTGESTGAASTTDNPFTTIERQDIGISLTVKPQINEGDSITLEIKQSTESIAPSVDVASDIVTNKREIQTKALIRDGQTLVIGGLLQDDQGEQRVKVPILGDIPLIGGAFRSTSKSRTKTNLMVFIHPTILKDDAQMAAMTRERYEYMQGQQSTIMKTPMPLKREAPPTLPDFETVTPQ